MKSRHKRLALVAMGLAILGVAAALILNAFQSNLVFFYTPSQVVAKEAPQARSFRVGGLVEQGSVQRQADGVTVRFVVTDTANSLPVLYTGILPDLFKEGKGVVAQGQIGADGVFRAKEVLAKHDENYMPPEAADAVQRARKAMQESQKTLQEKKCGAGSPKVIAKPNDSRDWSFCSDRRAVHLRRASAGSANRHLSRGWRVDGGGAPCGTGAVRVRGDRIRLPGLVLRRQRFLGAQRSQQFQFEFASAIPLRRDLGQSRGVAAAVGVDAHRVDACGDRIQPTPASEMLARILSVMALISVGFLLFLLFTSNPFERLLPAAPDGRDLNPLLQDPGMVIHPPMLYMGYVGFSVAFAFSVAALLGGKLDAAWARWSRPWTTVAWAFLTVGICLGSGWAYYELGWGGWWFWDPVENASFMPWLVGTALVHSLAVTEKRGGFKIWTVLLAIIAFSLSLLGTFLVRSGVLTSVHAFATDPARGIFILAFLAIVVGSSLALFAWRAPKVGLGGTFNLISREAALLTNNVLLIAAAAVVLLGTLYPLFLDALGLGKLSVGTPWFEIMFPICMAPAVFLMGIGPIMRWKEAQVPDLAARLKWAFGIAVVTGLLVPVAMGKWTWLISLGLFLAAWIVAAGFVNLYEQVARLRDEWWQCAGTDAHSAARLLGHAGGAFRCGGVHRRRDHGEGIRDGKRCAHERGRHRASWRLPISTGRLDASPGAQLRGNAWTHSREPQRI